MKKYIALILVFSMLLPLSACGGKNKGGSDAPDNSAAITDENPVPVATPRVFEEYNSIDKVGRSEKNAVREELLAVAEGCRGIYEGAEKGTVKNVVLSDATIYAMVQCIGSMGYSAVDSLGHFDLVCPDPIVLFGGTIETGNDTAVSYYTVYRDGQITVYHLTRESGKWYLIAMSAVWDENCEPRVQTEGRYAVGDVRYTQKGYLIYTRDTASFDDNQRANTNSYVFVRVLPYAADKRALCDKYVAPIGYFENNLFTTTWASPDFNVIDFNSLYAYLFSMYHGTDTLSASNASEYFSMVKGANLYLIPTESFENVVLQYFNIDTTVLKAISDYSSSYGGYYFYGYADGIYNVTPRTPEPEVIEYHYNGDGTLTMTIDAVNRWYGTDKAFTHELTVYDDGTGFRYVSNKLLYADETIPMPETRLSLLLNAEKAKTE